MPDKPTPPEPPMTDSQHTPTPVTFHCKACGWEGEVTGRPRCLACYRARTAAWRKNNPEQAKRLKATYAKRYKTDRPEEFKARRRRLRNAETNRQAMERRRQWLLAGDVTREQLEAIYREYDGRCAYCRCQVRTVRFDPIQLRGFDHVRSRIAGGKHTAKNIVLCCGDCNALKGG